MDKSNMPIRVILSMQQSYRLVIRDLHQSFFLLCTQPLYFSLDQQGNIFLILKLMTLTMINLIKILLESEEPCFIKSKYILSHI